MAIAYRKADRADVQECVAMAMRFLTEGPYGDVQPDAIRLEQLALRLIGSADADIIVATWRERPIGMLALHVFEHPMMNRRVASELCWWIEPEYRGGSVSLRLIEHAQTWAKVHGAESMEMVAATDQVGVVYERLGYAKFETHYKRSLV